MITSFGVRLAISCTASVIPCTAALAQQFSPPFGVLPGANGASFIAAGDLDGDGFEDVACSSSVDGSIRWCRNLGGLQFGAPQLITTSAQRAISVRIADLDGDGDLDLLSSSEDDDKVAWYENNGAAGFSAQHVIAVLDRPRCMATGDFDGDGLDDVVVGHFTLPGTAWFANLGGGLFTPMGALSPVFRADDIRVADIDGDGDSDIVGLAATRVSWWENLNGSFGPERLIAAAQTYGDLAVEDLDGDGLQDVAIATSADNRVAWFRNQGSGSFGAAQVVAAGIGEPWTIDVADVDLDGLPDLIWGSRGSPPLNWHSNLGSGGFGPAQPIEVASQQGWVKCVLMADLDGDGDEDLLSADSGMDRIACNENREVVLDCNQNGIPDIEDVASGTSQDCNANGIPDECEIASGEELDCNANGIPDSCDIAAGVELDCSLNGIPDACEIAADATLDLNANGTLDPCEAIGTTYCFPATANSTGLSGEVALLGSEIIVLNQFFVSARQLPPSSFGFFIASTVPGSINPVPNSQGTLCVIGDVGRGVGGGIFNAGLAGAYIGYANLLSMPQPNGPIAVLAGETWNFQAWYRDAIGGQTTSNFTDAVAVTFQ